jgi:hypothetical protein
VTHILLILFSLPHLPLIFKTFSRISLTHPSPPNLVEIKSALERSSAAALLGQALIPAISKAYKYGISSPMKRTSSETRLYLSISDESTADFEITC